MNKFFKKLNWLPGILLIIPFAFVGKLAENISRALLGLLQNISYYFDFMGVTGGYIGMFWEKLIMEGVGTFVFCAVTLCGPIYLNKKFFPKFNINWLPAIIFGFLYFAFFGLIIIVMFFKGFGKADWIDNLSFFVMSVGYVGGFLAAMVTSALYAEIKHPLIDKLK